MSKNIEYRIWNADQSEIIPMGYCKFYETPRIGELLILLGLPVGRVVDVKHVLFPQAHIINILVKE